MARRKGWDSLTQTYRHRLERGGITKEQYDSGVPLEGPRGHANPYGVSERKAAILRRLIKSTDSWASNDNPQEIVANTIAIIGFEATVARLFRKARDYYGYHQAGISGPGTPGYIAWHNRKIYISDHLYWYH